MPCKTRVVRCPTLPNNTIYHYRERHVNPQWIPHWSESCFYHKILFIIHIHNLSNLSSWHHNMYVYTILPDPNMSNCDMVNASPVKRTQWGQCLLVKLASVKMAQTDGGSKH